MPLAIYVIVINNFLQLASKFNVTSTKRIDFAKFIIILKNKFSYSKQGTHDFLIFSIVEVHIRVYGH